jgi:hypothetical protein
MPVSHKKTKQVRFGTGRAQVPADVHGFLIAFAPGRGYQRLEDAVWYLCRVASRVLPITEDGAGKSTDAH